MTVSILTALSERIRPLRPVLVVFGRDGSGKPHASWFNSAEVELATKAAGLMKMRVFELTSDEQREFAENLARGRVFASGKAFAPFVKKDLYAKLIEHVGVDGVAGEAATLVPGGDEPVAAIDDAVAAEAPPLVTGVAASSDDGAVPPTPAARLPRDWNGIGVGSLVLATTGPAEGWYEALVLKIDGEVNGEVLTLRWRDYPEEGTVLRRVGQLGLLPPGQS